MKVEISNGELLDKASILGLKLFKIEDKNKLVNIRKEYETLKPLVEKLLLIYGSRLQELNDELAKINGQLWDIEDWIRDCEKRKDFGSEFIQLARSVYVTNDRRSEVKKSINTITDSELVEEKSYDEYK